jgi:hypothetical protein
MTLLWVTGFFLSLSVVRSATIFKADSPNNLNLAGSWSNNVAPGASDIATWNHLVSVNTNSASGTNLNWSGIKILDPAGPISFAAGFNLTNGSSGIDLSHATTSLILSNNLVSDASQTWKITHVRRLPSRFLLDSNSLKKASKIL